MTMLHTWGCSVTCNKPFLLHQYYAQIAKLMSTGRPPSDVHVSKCFKKPHGTGSQDAVCFLGHLYGHKSRVASVRSEGLSEVTRSALHDLSVCWEQERVTAQATRSAEKHRKKKVESADGESFFTTCCFLRNHIVHKFIACSHGQISRSSESTRNDITLQGHHTDSIGGVSHV